MNSVVYSKKQTKQTKNKRKQNKKSWPMRYAAFPKRCILADLWKWTTGVLWLWFVSEQVYISWSNCSHTKWAGCLVLSLKVLLLYLNVDLTLDFPLRITRRDSEEGWRYSYNKGEDTRHHQEVSVACNSRDKDDAEPEWRWSHLSIIYHLLLHMLFLHMPNIFVRWSFK